MERVLLRSGPILRELPSSAILRDVNKQPTPLQLRIVEFGTPKDQSRGYPTRCSISGCALRWRSFTSTSVAIHTFLNCIRNSIGDADNASG